jgi:hypothetical protein
MTPAATMDARVIYEVEAGLWSRGTAIVFDGGEFPRARIGEVAAIADTVIVVGDRGTAEALRSAGVGSVSVADGTDLRAALQLTTAARAPVVFCGVPAKPSSAITSAISAVTDPTGTQLPVAAVMFMREKAPSGGPLCPLAERSFVSGYGALFSIMLAGKTGRSVRIVAPRADQLKPTHAEVVATALQLARSSGTHVEICTDPAPRSWAVSHSPELSAIFCGVLEARGQSAAGGSKVARKAGDEADTAAHLLQEAACDVVVVFDRVALVHGTTAGASVAKAIGATMLAAVAVGGVAAPAAAATAPPPISQVAVQVPKNAPSRRAVDGSQAATGGDATTAGSGAAADQAGETNYGTADPTGTEDYGTADQTGIDDTVTADGTNVDQVQPGSQTDEVAVDEPDSVADSTDISQSDIEIPQEYIAFRVWTDSHGNNHVISSGLQDHWVDTPALPDWAVADGGDHPWLAKPDPDYVSPESIRAEQGALAGSASANEAADQHAGSSGQREGTPSSTARNSRAARSAQRATPKRNTGAKAGKHTAGKKAGKKAGTKAGKKAGKQAGKKAGKHGKSGKQGTARRNRSGSRGATKGSGT